MKSDLAVILGGGKFRKGPKKMSPVLAKRLTYPGILLPINFCKNASEKLLQFLCIKLYALS